VDFDTDSKRQSARIEGELKAIKQMAPDGTWHFECALDLEVSRRRVALGA
jgi:hypothetical protein